MMELALFPVAKGAESFDAKVINQNPDARDSLTPGKYIVCQRNGHCSLYFSYHVLYGKTNDNSQINLFNVIRIVFNQRFDD